jgi:hypothetical protein
MPVTLNSSQALSPRLERRELYEGYGGYEGADGDYFAYVLQIVRENNFWIELSICSESYRIED